MKHDARAQNLRVGLFLTAGLLLFVIAVFAIGEKGGLFEAKTKIAVFFDDISGLVEGAPVRLAGLDVGTVSKIEFPQALDRREARVTLSIKSKYMRRIRRDSVAMIDSKGLLGDKIINITLGNAKQAEVLAGGVLSSRKAPSIEHLASSVDDAVSSIARVTKSADTAIQQLTTEQMRGDIGRIATSTANILQEVEQGSGFAHRAIYDPKYGQEVEDILLAARATVTRLQSALERVDRTVAAVEHGDGLAHEIIYGQQGTAAIGDLRDAAAELTSIVHQIRDGNGLLHGLIFEPKNARALSELSQAATHLNHIMSDIEKGRGTIGGLMVDPSVYEDLKTVLGNVERNVLLKALIRFTIKEGNIRRPATLPVERSPQQDGDWPPSPASH
jgi:phospholipid/cholesterol/gamma-HCH transport system substrate-binding protein